MLAAYRGVSSLSRTIIFLNDGPYSHVAWVDDDTGDVYEAWSGGVRRVPSVHHGHTPGTQVDLYPITGEEHVRRTALRQFMAAQVGKPYDYSGVFRFVTRGTEPDTDSPPHWFCSRLLACGYRLCGLELTHAPDWKVNPTDCTYSLRSTRTPIRSVTTLDTRILDYRTLRGYERGPEETLWRLERE